MKLSRDGSYLFGHNFRYFVLVLGSLCLSSIFSNMIVLNFTVICMNPDRNAPPGLLRIENFANGTAHFLTEAKSSELQDETGVYGHWQKAILQWTVAAASALATFPLSWLCTRYGSKWIFVASGVASALATAASPLAMRVGFGVFVSVRVVQGVAYACDFAVIGVLCAHWASLSENGIFLGGLTLFSATASFFTNSVSGFLCASLGWPWAYYFHAFFSLALFAAWAFFYTDDPRYNRFVCAKELTIIHRDKTEAHKNHDSFIPYWAICKDGIVWTVWLTASVNLLCGFFLIMYTPTYIKRVLKYSMAETGMFGGLILLLHIPFKLLFGFLSDFLTCVTEKSKFCLFNSLAMLAPAFVFVYLCFTTLPLLTLLLFAIVQAAMGANSGGFYKCGTLVSRQYAEFVIAGTQFIKCLVFFVAPAMVAIFVRDESDPSQWHVIFYILAGALILSNVLFCVCATDEPRKFTQITRHTKHIAKHTKDKDTKGAKDATNVDRPKISDTMDHGKINPV